MFQLWTQLFSYDIVFFTQQASFPFLHWMNSLNLTLLCSSHSFIMLVDLCFKNFYHLSKQTNTLSACVEVWWGLESDQSHE